MRKSKKGPCNLCGAVVAHLGPTSQKPPAFDAPKPGQRYLSFAELSGDSGKHLFELAERNLQSTSSLLCQ